MLAETLLLLLQAALLGGLVRLSMTASQNELQRIANPMMWLTFFYTLWFLIPQIFAMLPAHAVVGMDDVPPYTRASEVLRTQVHLIIFLVSLATGYLMIMLACSKSFRTQPDRPPLDPVAWWYAIPAYLIGIVAFYKMGSSFAAMPEGTLRSALVKTTTGKLLYILSTFGSFAAAYLFSRLWLLNRRLLATASFLLFAAVAFSVNGRGRILWPAALALLFIWTQRRKVSLTTAAIFGLTFLMILPLMDPLFFSIRLGDMTRLREALDPGALLTTLFYDRNFDGFANLMFILHHDQIAPNPISVITGTREAFMSTYFPDVYQMGVAFPTTVPGEFWIAGRMPFLIAFGCLYGVLLGLLNTHLRLVRSEAGVWIYLLAAPWLTAVGGELVESTGKIVASVFPAALWLILSPMVKTLTARTVKHRYQEPGSAVTSPPL